jgi:tetratricopeptide (TPR) repeat protein
MRAAGWLLVLALLAGGSAQAQSAEVKKFLNAAVTLFENLEYEKALKQVQKARVKATGPDDEMRLSLFEGVVLAEMGKEEKALTAFKTGFGFDVNAKLPLEVSPKVAVLAEKARANVKKLLAPQLEEEARKAAEEKKRADDEATAKLAELKRKEEEEARLRAAPPPSVTKQPPPKSEPTLARRLFWVPGVLGLVAGGVATGCLLAAGGQQTALLEGRPATVMEAMMVRDSGKGLATAGYILLGVAGAGVVTSLLMFLLGGEAPPPVAVVPQANGAMLVLTMGGW